MMLEIAAVEPLQGRTVRLTLSDGTAIERDLTELLVGPVFEPLAEDAVFRCATVDYGTVVWPGGVDLAPETLIWNGPYPPATSRVRPAPYLRLDRPTG